jgi:hypothetical protein
LGIVNVYGIPRLDFNVAIIEHNVAAAPEATEGVGDASASPCTVYDDEIKFRARGVLDGFDVRRLTFMQNDRNIASVSRHALAAGKPIRIAFDRVNFFEVAGIPLAIPSFL